MVEDVESGFDIEKCPYLFVRAAHTGNPTKRGGEYGRHLLPAKECSVDNETGYLAIVNSTPVSGPYTNTHVNRVEDPRPGSGTLVQVHDD